jgi:hypothetical protein
MWTLLVGLCALACPLSMGAMMLMMRRRHGDGASRSGIGDSGWRKSRRRRDCRTEGGA